MKPNENEDRSPSPSEVEEQLARIAKSTSFSKSDRLLVLLSHIARETVAGHEERLLGKNIAVDVFDQNDASRVEDYSTVRVEVGRLRRRLHQYYEGPGASDPVRITVPKGGYTATFERINTEGGKIGEFEGKQPSREEKKRHILKRPSRMTSFVAASVIAIIGLSILWFAPWQQEAVPAKTPKIAVLQFANTDRDAGDLFLARGFTTELIIALAHYDHMVVVSRAVSARYSGAKADVREIGHDLSTQYVIQGSVRKEESQLIVNVELAETQSATIVWGKSYTKRIDSLTTFETAAAIAEEIAKTVAKPHGVIYQETIASNPATTTADFTSYQCILKAYDYERQRGADYHRVVRSCLESTVKREPGFATAWLLLSITFLDEFRNGYNPGKEYDALDRALEYALRATILAPENPEAHWTLALVYYFQKDFSKYLESGEKALALSANDADVVANFGFKLAISGQWERGLELLERAIQMSPAHPPLWHFPFVLNYYRLEAYDDALAEARNIDIPKLYMTHVFRAMVYGQLGRSDEAQAAVAEILKRKPAYGDNVRADFRRRNVPEPVIGQIVDGLRKAGLRMPAEN